ncbi:MAG: hypothetical protein HWD59_09140 [Coxiellaceae bacterium]|nr:MAG: hypothetical protein HWD59_09140 [Coxiellaceae bacterium]
MEDELRGTEETQENVKGEKIQKARNLRLPKQDSTADSMPLEKAASVEISSLQSNFEINFNYALSFLLEKQHDKAIESFRDLYEKARRNLV